MSVLGCFEIEGYVLRLMGAASIPAHSTPLLLHFPIATVFFRLVVHGFWK